MFNKKNIFIFILSLLSTTMYTYAHEVYVLSKDVINKDIALTSPNPFSIIPVDENLFLFWGFLSALIIFLVLLFSLNKKIERYIDPFLFKIKKYAPLIARVTFGLCLLASARYGALFGPELPFSDFVGTNSHLLSWLFYILGTSILLGLFVRFCSFIVLIIFIFSIKEYGIYMFTYANYLGEIIINIILGGGAFSICGKLFKRKFYFDNIFLYFEKYAFFFMRILFGIAVIFASFYAKFLHSQLALDVVTEYHLTNYFHFTPIFIVLGAFIVEFLIGLFFILGIEVRFVALVFLTFLALSLSYFGEAVWPHIILIGVNIALFVHGYDRYTLESATFKQKQNREPVL